MRCGWPNRAAYLRNAVGTFSAAPLHRHRTLHRSMTLAGVILGIGVIGMLTLLAFERVVGDAMIALILTLLIPVQIAPWVIARR